MKLKLTMLTATLVTALGISACSSPSQPSASLPPNKDTLIIANGAEPATLDPQKSQDTTSSAIIRQMFEGLVMTDAQGKIIPGLAESWETTDNKVWTFKLRDANWSNGDAISAHDAVFALQRLVDPATAAYYSSYLVDAKVHNAEKVVTGDLPVDALGVKALDDKTLQITLDEPAPYLVDMLALPVAYPVPKAVVQAHGDGWLSLDNIVVSGAYRLSDWVVNSHINLERNPAYYDNANTAIEKVQFLPITSSAGMNRYMTGELDINGVPPEVMDKVRKDLPNEMHTAPQLCTFYLEPNFKSAPFDDARVRQALSMSIERKTLTDILKRDNPEAYQFTPLAIQGITKISPDWQALDQSARYEQAISLLKDAGYDVSNPLKFEFFYSTSETAKMLASAIDSMWRQNLGGAVQVSLINQEWKTFLDAKNQGRYNLAFSGWCADYNEPSSFLNILKTGNSNNTGKYSSPQYDAIMAQTLQPGIDDAARSGLYQEAETLIAKDTAIIPMYSSIAVRLIKPYVKGFSHDNPMDDYHVKDMSFE